MTTPRRRRAWQDNILDTQLSSGTQTSFSLVDAAVPDTKGTTMVRCILGLDVRATVPVLNNLDSQTVSMGIGLASGDAAAAGVFADPNTEADQPVGGWLWRWQGLVFKDSLRRTRIDVDVRSQRKLMYGDLRLIISSDPDQGTAFAVQVIGLVRSLYLLP